MLLRASHASGRSTLVSMCLKEQTWNASSDSTINPLLVMIICPTLQPWIVVNGILRFCCVGAKYWTGGELDMELLFCFYAWGLVYLGWSSGWPSAVPSLWFVFKGFRHWLTFARTNVLKELNQRVCSAGHASWQLAFFESFGLMNFAHLADLDSLHSNNMIMPRETPSFLSAGCWLHCNSWRQTNMFLWGLDGKFWG